LTKERRNERGRETFLEERKDSIKNITEHDISDYFSQEGNKYKKGVHKAGRRKNRNRKRHTKKNIYIRGNEQRRYMDLMIKRHANQIIMNNVARRVKEGLAIV